MQMQFEVENFLMQSEVGEGEGGLSIRASGPGGGLEC
jgi:hypothetical protein